MQNARAAVQGMARVFLRIIIILRVHGPVASVAIASFIALVAFGAHISFIPFSP